MTLRIRKVIKSWVTKVTKAQERNKSNPTQDTQAELDWTKQHLDEFKKKLKEYHEWKKASAKRASALRERSKIAQQKRKSKQP